MEIPLPMAHISWITKRLRVRFGMCCMAALTITSACKKQSTEAKLAPFTFSLTVHNFVSGSPVTATVNTSLKDGNYTLFYHIPDLADGCTTALNVVSGYSSFTTPAIKGKLYSYIISADSLKDASGTMAAVNKFSGEMFDSSGIVTGKMNGIPFQATRVLLDTSSGQFRISFDLGPERYVEVRGTPFTGIPASFSFTSVSGYKNGYADFYGKKDHEAAYGRLSITSRTPYVQGSFSFTTIDSIHLTDGTFTITTP